MEFQITGESPLLWITKQPPQVNHSRLVQKMEDTFLMSTPFKTIKVHPVVPFLILDQYVRRPEGKKHAMGNFDVSNF